MIIVSQDKERIFNFDRIDFITICREAYGTCVYVDGSYGTRVLGTYKTEERAKEVLSLIYKVYSDQTLIKHTSDDIQKKLIAGDKNEYFDVFEMPED